MAILESVGQESLPSQVEILLNDPAVNGIVVRNFCDTRDLERARDPHDLPKTSIKGLYTVAPMLSEVDQLVHTWWETYRSKLPSTKKVSDRLEYLYDVNTGIFVHVDTAIEGPLVVSLRLDTNTDVERRFLAHKYIPEPTSKNRSWRDMHVDADRIAERLEDTEDIWANSQYETIDQKPGDAVIIAHYPYPTIHAVRESQKGMTLSLIARHCIYRSGL